jgi:hypothetical protein
LTQCAEKDLLGQINGVIITGRPGPEVPVHPRAIALVQLGKVIRVVERLPHDCGVRAVGAMDGASIVIDGGVHQLRSDSAFGRSAAMNMVSAPFHCGVPSR